MSIKDTLTNNSMNSFSFGGKTYTRRVDNGAVVYDISAGTDGSAFSTGWVDQDASGTDVANGAKMQFNHNLGTSDIIVEVWVADDINGTNNNRLNYQNHDSGATIRYGAAVHGATNNTIGVVLGSYGYIDEQGDLSQAPTGVHQFESGGVRKYIKVVVSAKMGSGGGGGTPAGSDRELQFNDNGAFGANANLRFDGSTAFLPRLAIGEGNVSGDEGGEIFLKHAPNGTLAGDGVAIDIFQNKLRIFEYGSPYKGAYIDLTECAEYSAGLTNLLAGGSGGGGGGYGGFIDSGTFITQGGNNHTFPDFDANTQVVFAVRVGLGDELTEVVADGSTQTLLGGSGNSYGGNPGARVTLTSAGVTTGSDTLSGNTSYTIKVYRFTRGSSTGGTSGTSGTGGGASVTTDPTAPTNPSDGDLWYDEDGAALYVYTDSIGGWIQANGGGGGGSGPRAYVAFDGTSSNLTGSITNSFNVSSITDNGAGDYTITFTTPVNNPIISLSNSVGGSTLGNENIMLKSDPTNASATIVISQDTTGASVNNRDSTYVSFIAH